MIAKLKSAIVITAVSIPFLLLLFWVLDPSDEEAAAAQCRANGGLYYYHRHECRHAQARTE